MEVNARVQVEHPVSEMVTGVDIIRQQILAASGESLETSQDEVRLGGYAVECRINARSAGRVTRCRLPGGFGVRVDTFLHDGAVVSPHYDHLVAKLIVSGKTRAGGPRTHGTGAVRAGHRGHRDQHSPSRRASWRTRCSAGASYGTGFMADMLKEGPA